MAAHQNSKIGTLATGCIPLDKILHGGLNLGQLTLIYGEGATGKTTIALQCAINSARRGFNVLYIDTDRTFPVERFKQIAPDYKRIALLIGILTPKDFFEQTILIENLDAYITERTGLIVADSVNSLYRLESKDADRLFMCNKELNRNLAYLASFSKRSNLPVLITSQVHSLIQNETQPQKIEPVATRALNFWSSTIIELKSNPQPNMKTAILERRNWKDFSNVFCFVKLTSSGVV